MTATSAGCIADGDAEHHQLDGEETAELMLASRSCSSRSRCAMPATTVLEHQRCPASARDARASGRNGGAEHPVDGTKCRFRGDGVHARALSARQGSAPVAGRSGCSSRTAFCNRRYRTRLAQSAVSFSISQRPCGAFALLSLHGRSRCAVRLRRVEPEAAITLPGSPCVSADSRKIRRCCCKVNGLSGFRLPQGERTFYPWSPSRSSASIEPRSCGRASAHRRRRSAQASCSRRAPSTQAGGIKLLRSHRQRLRGRRPSRCASARPCSPSSFVLQDYSWARRRHRWRVQTVQRGNVHRGAAVPFVRARGRLEGILYARLFTTWSTSAPRWW